MKRQCHFFSHNKRGKITIKHWELDLFFILHFTYLGVGVRTHPTRPPPPTGLVDALKSSPHCRENLRARCDIVCVDKRRRGISGRRYLLP